MSELMAPGARQFDGAQIMALDQIGTEALSIVGARYGSGYPHYHGGESGGLSYHNRHHSWAVQQGVEVMGVAIGLSRTELAIGRAAAAAHDIVQLKDRGIMEQESADWFKQEMQAKDVPSEVRSIGVLAILGTEPILKSGLLVGQVAERLDYPSQSAELVAKSVACADLGEIHSAHGPLLGHELFKEINNVAPSQEPSMGKLIAFQRGQLWLAENYQYPLAAGERVFGVLRSEAVAYSAKILDELEHGRIESWQELIARDQVFLRSHS